MLKRKNKGDVLKNMILCLYLYPMDERYLYLLLNIGAISIPLIASFYPRAPFYKLWPALSFAIALPALLFILWDIFFTHLGVWGFNERYLIGLEIFNLPLEELLFFICIPYACTFTYFAFSVLLKKNLLSGASKYISIILIIFLMVTGIIFIDRVYSSTTFIALAAFLAVHTFIWRSDYMDRFYFTFLVILIPFFLINGILTGSFIEGQVVWYNDNENLGIRIGTIPVEDGFYGMLLILMNITILEKSTDISKITVKSPGVGVEQNTV